MDSDGFKWIKLGLIILNYEDHWMLKYTEVQSSKITILLKSFLQGGCYFFWCTFARVSITDFACPKKMMCHDWVSLFCQHAMTEGDKILTPARCPMSRFLSIWVLANKGKFIKHLFVFYSFLMLKGINGNTYWFWMNRIIYYERI